MNLPVFPFFAIQLLFQPLLAKPQRKNTPQSQDSFSVCMKFTIRAGVGIEIRDVPLIGAREMRVCLILRRLMEAHVG
jgi:hypothetical protein